MTTTWKEFRKELDISPEDEQIIALEKELIKTLIQIREEKNLTQTQLANLCHMKQPVISRAESSTHSLRLDSLLRILTPLGYTLQIVPLSTAKTGKSPKL